MVQDGSRTEHLVVTGRWLAGTLSRVLPIGFSRVLMSLEGVEFRGAGTCLKGSVEITSAKPPNTVLALVLSIEVRATPTCY